jgi:hypothetical protein
MNERDFREVLHEILALRMDEGNGTIIRVRTFSETGLLVMNEGLVVKAEDGSEFQLMIVQSK